MDAPNPAIAPSFQVERPCAGPVMLVVRPQAIRHRDPQPGVAAARFDHSFEDNTMTSGQPEDGDKTKREQRQRRIRIVGVFMLMLGVPPLLNALGNPRVQALHGADVLGLIASGLVIGFGLGLLLSKIMFRGR